MSKKRYIKRSNYNVTATELLQLQAEEKKLNQWHKAKSSLEGTFRLITNIENRSCNAGNALSRIINYESFSINTTTFEIDKISEILKSCPSFEQTFIKPIEFDYAPVPYLLFPTDSERNSLIPSPSNKTEVAKITENLRLLKIRLKHNFSRDLLFEIKILVLELRHLVSDQLKKQKKTCKENQNPLPRFFCPKYQGFFPGTGTNNL